MTHGIAVMLATLAVFVWCLIGTALLNHLPLLSDPRLYGKLRRGIPACPLLVAIVIIIFWPARKLICSWLTGKLAAWTAPNTHSR